MRYQLRTWVDEYGQRHEQAVAAVLECRGPIAPTVVRYADPLIRAVATAEMRAHRELHARQAAGGSADAAG